MFVADLLIWLNPPPTGFCLDIINLLKLIQIIKISKSDSVLLYDIICLLRLQLQDERWDIGYLMRLQFFCEFDLIELTYEFGLFLSQS